jgi:hypothetical protein
VTLSAQFYTEDFSQKPVLLGWGGSDGGMIHGIGDYFRVEFPDNWPDAQKYDIDWEALSKNGDPFVNFRY